MSTYGFDTFFKRITNKKELGFSLMESVTLLICEMLHDPVSKPSNFINQKDYFGIEHIDLHQIYRTLDHLYGSEHAIKELIYHKGLNIFNQKLDLVFYDVPTFYFDSD